MTIQDIGSKIKPILENEGIKKAAIFGSHATGEAKESSDVDLLVEFAGQKSLFDLVGLKLDLEEVLKQKVDILTYRSIHPSLRNIILKQQKIIYEKRS